MFVLSVLVQSVVPSASEVKLANKCLLSYGIVNGEYNLTMYCGTLALWLKFLNFRVIEFEFLTGLFVVPLE